MWRTAASSPNGGPERYDHVLFYAHGGLTGLNDVATHAALKLPVLKAFRIYPVFFLWRTGAFGAICDLLF